MVRVISSARASVRRASLRKMSARSCTEVCDQPGKARAAACAARSTSSAVPRGATATGSSVAGLVTVSTPLAVEGTHAPSMKMSLCSIM